MSGIDKFLGRRIVFRNGLSLGFSWTHGNGCSSKTSAMIASFHPPRSITWLWAVYWIKPRWNTTPHATRGHRSWSIGLPLLGSLMLITQAEMLRPDTRKGHD
jgi:hypothetical protein